MLELLRLPRALLVPISASAILLAGCAKAGSEQSAPKVPSFAKDVQPIFDNNCVACHQSVGAQQALILEPGKSFANIVGVKSKESGLRLITPDNAGQSYLLLKLEGKQQQAGGSGAQMPLGDALSPAQIATVQQWIEAGAPDN